MTDYPVHPDPMFKFKKNDNVCATGEPVVDHAILFSGEACCSSCRKTMTLVDGVWIHD